MIGFDRFLVFDESDEIANASPKQRSQRFIEKLRQHGFVGGEQFHIIQRVSRHFYVVDY